MRPLFFTILFSFFLTVSTRGAEDALSDAIRAAAEKIGPRLVRIDTIGGYDKVGDELANEGATTGLLLDSQGYIVTSSFNFLHEPSSILVRFHDGTRKVAKIVATDSNRRLTLLKVEGLEQSVEPPARSTEPVRIGQYVVAVGRAFSMEEPNVSLGILSGENRIWGKAIQTDAKVSPNNYGGPLLNLKGEVLGICVPLSPMSDAATAGAEMYDAGVGLAIPWNNVLDSFERLKEGKNIESGFLGLGFGELALFIGPAVIETVVPKSPAEEAGLQKGDRIVQIDGETIGSASAASIRLHRHYAGETVKITVVRGENAEEIRVEIPLITIEAMKKRSPLTNQPPE